MLLNFIILTCQGLILALKDFWQWIVNPNGEDLWVKAMVITLSILLIGMLVYSFWLILKVVSYYWERGKLK